MHELRPKSQQGPLSWDRARSLHEELDAVTSPEVSSRSAVIDGPPDYTTAMASTDGVVDPVIEPRKSTAGIVLAAETTAACLKRIGETLDQLERSGNALVPGIPVHVS